MRTIFNGKNVDRSKQPIFFGEELGLQRLDNPKYKKFLQLYKDQWSFIWRPSEISLIKDATDYQKLTENEKFIFTTNLKFQTVMDSCISRGVDILLPYISLPEVELCCKVWGAFEGIHSESYNYIMENVYPDFSSVLDSIADDNEITKRGEKVKEWYDKLIYVDEANKHETLYKTLISINILEAVQFFVSFVCAFAFGHNNTMIGNASIIKLIRRDENLHLQITQNMLSYLHNNPDEGFIDVANDCRDEFVDMFVQAVDEEKGWAKYLFKDGSILGLNEAVLCEYIEWLANLRLKTLGLPQPYPNAKNHMQGWLTAWTGQTQTAPQEQENTEYKIGASKSDIKNMDFGNLEL